MKRTTLNVVAPDIFNLASNLFGSQRFENPQTTATATLQQAVAITVATLPQHSKTAVYNRPFIALAPTMDNYRKQVALKNFQINESNTAILQWNCNVRKFKKENQGKLSEVQKTMSDLFPKSLSNKNLDPTAYNDKVDAFCKEYGMLVQKKCIQTIKPPTELFFQNAIYLYNQQLMKKNDRYDNHFITAKTPLEPYKFNSYKFTQLKRNGAPSFNYTSKTITNHRKRLQEFGIFTNYVFHGRQRAVDLDINLDILVVEDRNQSKSASIENQSVTYKVEQLVTDNNVSFTRTSLNEVKRNEKVKNFSQDKEFPSVMPFIFSFTGTPPAKCEIASGPRAEIEKKQNNPSDKALATLTSDRELAMSLENNEFNNYTPIDIRFLYWLAISGTLTKDEFFEVAMFDFFKTLQKNIYKTRAPYFGSWYTAIQDFRRQRWQRADGMIYKNDLIVDKLQQYRWQIQWARKWFAKNPNVTPLFPNQYLDVTRKSSKEIGFDFLSIKYKAMKDDNAKYDSNKKKQEIAARKRGEAINHNKKMELQLNRFFKDKITMNQLYDYVDANLPQQFKAKVADLIEARNLKNCETTFKLQYNFTDF